MRWDSTADAKLFLAVLKVHSLKLNYEAIAKLMGEDCTAKAISHRIAKLKNLGGDVGSPSSIPNTPTKAKTPTKRKRSDNNDLIAIKREHIEHTLDSDASTETFIDSVSTGSPKKRRRPSKPAPPAPPVEISFAPTEPDADADIHTPHSTLYSSSETSSYDPSYDYLDASFDPAGLASLEPQLYIRSMADLFH
ncbi:hypothetical protein H072_5050 [Dactylellina haptotyla CBS 200.50]|uniref:Uncharacterized protein n=1 Tax=Dactylellina haptotyla (strain CBS 200.50) TaxID=1284197 RepID=S8AIT4_DACHA|nr:hypothetical protein H072_5050 [Dactylellina haptotyla CBS 200.50]